MLRCLPLILLCAPLSALAAPVVVWMEPAVPDAKVVQKTANRTGDAQQLAHAALAFPAQPLSDVDKQRYEALRAAVVASRARWDEFDVEFGIATDLETALSAIDVIRDERDADAIIEARSLQGSAVLRAFDPTDFQEGERASPFRVQYGTAPFLNRSWVDALAVDADHKLEQALVDPSTWPDMQKMQDSYASLPDGKLDLTGLPAGVKLMIDGRAADTKDAQLPLRAGAHYVYADRDGKVSGRARIEISPEATTPLPVLVSKDELAAAHARVMAGDASSLEGDVKTALDGIAAANGGGPVYVAANEGSKVVLLPYTKNALLVKQTPVTLLLDADIGPELVVSPIFNDSAGANVTSPAVSGSLGVELGITYGAILGGMDAAITPLNTIDYGNSDSSANVTTFALPQPWGGVGAYVLRPTGHNPTLLVAGTYGWDGPANMAFGARATVGIPLKDEGSWLRVTLGGSTSSKSLWDETLGRTIPMHVLFLRVGLGEGLIH
jgi:hypothetical protein